MGTKKRTTGIVARKMGMVMMGSIMEINKVKNKLE